jgi:hypothetical protein
MRAGTSQTTLNQPLRLRQHFLEIHDFLDLHQKPPINLCQLKYLINAEPRPQRVPDEKEASVHG